MMGYTKVYTSGSIHNKVKHALSDFSIPMQMRCRVQRAQTSRKREVGTSQKEKLMKLFVYLSAAANSHTKP